HIYQWNKKFFSLLLYLEWYETTISKNRIIRKKCLHQHLKEVKYSGYFGGFVDMDYETQSGQKVNNDKNSIYLHQNVATEDRQVVEDCTNIKMDQFLFKCLNRPKLIQGKEKSTIQSLFNDVRIHVLSAIVPPSFVLKEFHRIFATFFWSNKSGFADRVLTTYLTKNSVALETFIIDPYKYDAQEARVRVRQQLQGKIPKRVKLLIL
ncbi:hypothetical protein H5410_062138, partial [Solanum commersonii]